jgi:hypothetical protein
MSSPKDSDGGAAGALQAVGAWATIVGKSPPAAVLAVGLLVVLAGTFTQICPLQIGARGSVTVLLSVGGLLILMAAIWLFLVRRTLTHHPAIVDRDDDGNLTGPPQVAVDATFLLDLFYQAMPPAFVMELDLEPTDPKKIRSTRHIIRNAAFLDVQRDSEFLPASLRNRARRDYNEADERALNGGRSWQLEVADHLADDHEPRSILTTKTIMRRDGKSYIVGWYVPVELHPPPKASEMLLKRETRQVVFRPVPARTGEGIAVHIASTLREPSTETQETNGADREL